MKKLFLISTIFLTLTVAHGQTTFQKTYGGTNADVGYSVEQTSDGGFVIAGYTPSFGAGNNDVYLIKTDGNGNSGCNESNPADVVTSPASITTTPATLVSFGGITGNPVTQTGSGGTETTLCTTVGINENNYQQTVSLYPNPFSTQTTLQLDKTLKNATLTVYNSFGQQVKQLKNINGQAITLHRDNLPSGLYFIRLTTPTPFSSPNGGGQEGAGWGEVATEKLIITD
ncbi:MAG: T9SS type A sorting domain-containing protein [Bacteroidetes bacterium]|nr:T9SS type A sorting domain-containing protein [Bacteroidota bacterium]